MKVLSLCISLFFLSIPAGSLHANEAINYSINTQQVIAKKHCHCPNHDRFINDVFEILSENVRYGFELLITNNSSSNVSGILNYSVRTPSGLVINQPPKNIVIPARSGRDIYDEIVNVPFEMTNNNNFYLITANLNVTNIQSGQPTLQFQIAWSINLGRPHHLSTEDVDVKQLGSITVITDFENPAL